jgi:hypothetical protein
MQFGEYGGRLYRGLQRQLRQDWTTYGLIRDLRSHIPVKRQSTSYKVRSYEQGDLEPLLARDLINATRRERKDILLRYAHLAENIPTCYVVEDQTIGEPVFIQWLMTERSNDSISRFFKGRFPKLSSKEALLENAYIPKHHRGRGVMVQALLAMSEFATVEGFWWIATFVAKDNLPSLKGCLRAGFYPFAIRRDVHLCFHRIKRREFVALSR